MITTLLITVFLTFGLDHAPTPHGSFACEELVVFGQDDADVEHVQGGWSDTDSRGAMIIEVVSPGDLHCRATFKGEKWRGTLHIEPATKRLYIDLP